MMGQSNETKREDSRILALQIAEFKANGGVVRVISKEETDERIRSAVEATRTKLKKDFTFDKK
jgi:hypothetical protein